MALFNFLAKPFSILLAFFYNITGHYWLAIVLLSVLIRVAMYPLYKKQILSTSGMADMQPKMNEIKKKYANDKDMMNQKIAELYKESGFNPSAGCMPMLVQFIVILSGIATFFSFSMSQQNQLGQQGSNMGMGMMKYIFPIMIVWLGRSYPAGLAIYWFISNFTQIFFNIRFNKLRKELKAKDKKGKKKKK